MPIYEYRCEHCGSQKDHLQKMSDAALTVCPACGSNRYVRQISAVGFQLKGSGWYATDFKSDKRDKSGGKSAPAGETPPTQPCGGNCACHAS